MAPVWPQRRWGPTSNPRRPETPDYRPVFLRLPFLFAFAAYIGLLIGVLEWSCRQLPTSSDDQTVPEGSRPGVRVILYQAPLFQASISAPKTKRATLGSTAAPEISKSLRGLSHSGKSHSAGRFRRQNSTTGDAPPVNSLRPPTSLGNRKAYPPEYLPLNQSYNTSQSWNNSVDSNRTLEQRTSNQASFAHLSGPTVGVVYEFLHRRDVFGPQYGLLDDLSAPPPPYVATLIRFAPPDTIDPAQCALSPVELAPGITFGGVWAIITCNGPAFVFHHEECWKNWQLAAQKERLFALDKEGPWEFYESLSYISGSPWTARCNGEDIAQDFDRMAEEYAASTMQDLTTMTINDDKGRPISTATAARVVVTETDSRGRPTTTVTRLQAAGIGYAGALTTLTETDAHGSPTATVTAQLITYTDSNGVGITTRTRLLSASETPLTLRDAHGVPTATLTMKVGPTATRLDPTTIVLTNSEGIPTATITAAPRPPHPTATIYSSAGENPALYILSHSDYYLLLFMPVLCTVVVSILAEMVSSNLHVLLPFQQMATGGAGASARESLFLPRGVLAGFAHSIRLLAKGDPLSFLSQVLVLVSALVTALSSEAVGIGLGGSCKRDSFDGCYLEASIFLPPARALQALLAVDMGIVVVIAGFLWKGRWRSGVSMPPGSIMATGALAQSGEFRELLRGLGTGVDGVASDKALLGKLDGWRFGLADFKNPITGAWEYGIVPRNDRRNKPVSPQTMGTSEKARLYRSPTKVSSSTFQFAKRALTRVWRSISLKWPLNRQAKSRISDCCGLLFVWGIVILVIYYNTTELPNTAFEKFMNQQAFGVRILFTALGVLLTFFWDHYYSRKSLLPSHQPQTPSPLLRRNISEIPPCPVTK